MNLRLADLTALPPTPLVPFSAGDVREWLRDPDHLLIEPEGFRVGYEAWRADVDARPHRQDVPPWRRLPARIAMCESLLRRADAGIPLAYTTVWRERQGGRRYFLWVEGATKLEVFGRWEPPSKYRSAAVLYLQQLPKTVRRVGLRARAGRVLIQIDICRAFLQFMACWSRDSQLLADLAKSDFHAAVGGSLGVSRDVAKVLNNSLVGLVSPFGLRDHLGRAGVAMTLKAAEQLYNDWWARYPQATRLRDTAWRLIATAAVTGRGIEIVAPDGRQFTFSPAEVREAKLDNGRTKGHRSVFSALWRAIEGVVADLAIAELHQLRASHDLRFVVGMYDGLMYSAPEDRAHALAEYARQVVERAMYRAGVPGRADATVHPYWWSK